MLLGLEVFILLLIIISQIIFFYSTASRIKFLEKLFPDFALTGEHIDVVADGHGNIEQIEISNHKNEEFQNIVKATNAYLRKNKGSADFGIIKNVAERVSESQEAAVVANIGLPLYIGLMGTFIGVILGLGILISDQEFGNEEIQGFILGVVVAMVGSLFGLFFTTINNSYNLRIAKAKRDTNKNNYYNFLQTELLPNLDNSLYSALESLKVNIGNFNEVFTRNTQSFDETFGKKIDVLKSAVSEISDNIGVVTEGNKVQKDFLIEIRKKGYVKMAEVSTEFFEKVSQAAPLLTRFIERQERLSSNIDNINDLTSRIKSLFDRIIDFEVGINRLGKDLQQSDLLGNELLILVRKHLNAINQKEQLIEDYSIKSTESVRQYLDKAFEEIEALKRKLELQFENAFKFDVEGNVLKKLNHLPEIELQLANLIKQDAGRKIDPTLEMKLTEISASLSELKAAKLHQIIPQEKQLVPEREVSNTPSEVKDSKPEIWKTDSHDFKPQVVTTPELLDPPGEVIVPPFLAEVIRDSDVQEIRQQTTETTAEIAPPEKPKNGWLSRFRFKKNKKVEG